jgi:hypothetical protein
MRFRLLDAAFARATGCVALLASLAGVSDGQVT